MTVGRGLGRRPALDGLRGVAILLVVLDHAEVRGFDDAGGVGVALFFTLSGYLITGQLLVEHEGTGTISFRDFYARRAWRLLPALYVMLTFTLLIFGLEALPSTAITALELANVPASHAGSGLIVPLHHMWSLAVEEQFYFVWPALLVLVLAAASRRSTSWLWIVLTSFALLGLVVRIGGFGMLGYEWAYHATLPNAFPLLAGAALAACTRAVPGLRLARASGALALVLLVVVATAPMPPGLTWVFARTVLAVPLTLALLVGAGPWALSVAPLRLAGRVSYGWYLWHVIAQMTFGGVLGSAVSLLVAATSFVWIEEPLRVRSRRRADRRRPSTSTVADERARGRGALGDSHGLTDGAAVAGA